MMIFLSYLYVYSLAFLFGAIIGSFLNVVIYRLPKGIFLENKRSVCRSCGAQIKSYDLIPLLSYLILRGKCRRCKAKISPQYPLIELVTGMLAVGLISLFGFSLQTLYLFAIGAIFIAITMIDFAVMEIPNSLLVALLPLCVMSLFLGEDTTLLSRIIGCFCVSLPMYLLATLIKGAFGGGDIKLIGLCGFLLGWQSSLVAVFIAILLGGGYASYLLLFHKRKKDSHIAFGPYLCVGVYTALIWGKEIWTAYLSLSGL